MDCIAVKDGEGETESEEEGEEGVWEFRTAGFGLVNAIIHGPTEVENRILLREEFGRRGLNEIMTVRSPLSSSLSITEALCVGTAIPFSAGSFTHSIGFIR